MYIGECVICGIQPRVVDICDNSSQGIDYNLLLSCLRTCEFRCSSINSSVDEICHTENNFMNEFCKTCHVAVARLINIYLQVNSFLKELEQLKSNVKTDIENACRQKWDSKGFDAGRNEERLSERTDSMRREISRALGITEEKVVNEGESHYAGLDITSQYGLDASKDELRAQSVIEEELLTNCYDDSPVESSSHHSDHESDERDPWSHLRQLHGVKDCTVRLERITPKEIADWASRIAPRKKIGRPKLKDSERRKKIRRGLLGKRIYCGFPGCSRFMFKEEDVERHQILKHGVRTNLSQSGQKLLEKYRYRCLEPLCTFIGLSEAKFIKHATVKHAAIPIDSSPKIRRSKLKNSAWKKIRRGLLGKRIYCGFPGCSRFMFKEEDVERHKILKHGVQTNLSQSGQFFLEKHRYPCLEPQCNFIGRTERSLKVHGRVKHATISSDSNVQVQDPTQHARIRCDQPGCSLTFFAPASIKIHKKEVHNVEHESGSNEKLVRYFCDVPGCKSSSYSEVRLNAHKAKVHENVSHPYKCDLCGQCLADLASYRMHLKAIHGGTKDAVCHICGKAFAVEEYLRHHMRMHSPPKVKCRFCPKVYCNASARVNHERSAHTGERPYVCDRCGKGFFHVRGLKKHVTAIHNKGIRPFVCQLCGKDFPIHDYLRMHYIHSHKGHPIPKSKECLRQPELPSTITDEPAITMAEDWCGMNPAVPT